MKKMHLEALHLLVLDLHNRVRALDERVDAMDVDVAFLMELSAVEDDECDESGLEDPEFGHYE